MTLVFVLFDFELVVRDEGLQTFHFPDNVTYSLELLAILREGLLDFERKIKEVQRVLIASCNLCVQVPFAQLILRLADDAKVILLRWV